MARYAPSQVPTTGDIAQLERYLREENEQVRGSTDDIYTLANFVADFYTVAGYGGIGLDAITALPNIGATWQTLPFDVELLSEPRGIQYVLGSEAMIFNEVGIWRINAKVSLEFAEAQNGRRIQLRVQNITTGVDAPVVFNFSVGRNTDGVNLNFNLLVEVPETAVGDIFVLQVNSVSDTFTGVQAIGSIWDANHVSEYKGDIFARTNISKASRWQ